jgi:putative Ca2+/H+ antiporter (TMEM165/GDT1 family)
VNIDPVAKLELGDKTFIALIAAVLRHKPTPASVAFVD